MTRSRQQEQVNRQQPREHRRTDDAAAAQAVSTDEITDLLDGVSGGVFSNPIFAATAVSHNPVFEQATASRR